MTGFEFVEAKYREDVDADGGRFVRIKVRYRQDPADIGYGSEVIVGAEGDRHMVTGFEIEISRVTERTGEFSEEEYIWPMAVKLTAKGTLDKRSPEARTTFHRLNPAQQAHIAATTHHQMVYVGGAPLAITTEYVLRLLAAKEARTAPVAYGIDPTVATKPATAVTVEEVNPVELVLRGGETAVVYTTFTLTDGEGS